MRILVLFLIFLFVISACNQTEKKNLNAKKNLLLDEEVVVTSIFADSVLQASPWKSPFKINNFISKLFYQVLQNKLNLYNPIFEDSVFHPLDKESWLSILRNNKHLTFDTTQFNDIYFYETWELDTLATIQFNKNVIFWAPIKTDKELKQRKLAGKVKCHASDANTLLAKHVIYEFPFEDSITPNFSLNKNKLVRLLIDKAIKKPSDAYHPFTAKPLTKDELYQRLEISDSSLFSPYHNISSIVFIENWYYNPENFSIRKEVLGLAPVKIIFNGDEPSKSIPFVFFFNETPFVLM